MALAYHRARGDGQRVRLVGRERAYHGVNFGGIAVGGIAPNRSAFGPGLPGALHLRHTWLPENVMTRGEPEHGIELADDLERLCALHGGDTIAACIVEPVAGSTGCLVPPRGYLHRLREICDSPASDDSVPTSPHSGSVCSPISSPSPRRSPTVRSP
jgi:beta-alanine--pyruvate transaminase